MLTDSHCHLGSHKFSREELDEIVGRARTNAAADLRFGLRARRQ